MFRAQLQWDVRKHTDYRQNPPVGDGSEPAAAHLYVQVEASGQAAGGFRFPVSGGTLETDIYGQDLFEDEDFHQFRFRYEIDTARIDIRPNSLTSKWEDWEELLARGVLVAYKGDDQDDVTVDVRKILHAKITNDPEIGAALRWSVQARGDRRNVDLWLVLQGLPRPAGYLRKDARFNTDHCGAIEVMATKLAVSFQEDEPCQGPIPVLFSRDVEKTKKELAANPELLHPGKILPLYDKCLTKDCLNTVFKKVGSKAYLLLH